MAGKYYIADSAEVMGDVRLSEDCSIWFKAILRADSNYIQVGKNTNIQDGCIVHMDAGNPVILGDNVTVGHGVILHGCTVGDNTVIGMGSILLNGSKVGKNCMIGAGSLVPQGKEIPDGTMAFGSPAAVKKELSPEAIAKLEKTALHYVEFAKDQLPEKDL